MTNTKIQLLRKRATPSKQNFGAKIAHLSKKSHHD
jgi:hypothetical protein